MSIWMTGWEGRGLILILYSNIVLMARLYCRLYLQAPIDIACPIKLIRFHISHVTTLFTLSHGASEIHWPFNSYSKNAYWSVSLLPIQYSCMVRANTATPEGSNVLTGICLSNVSFWPLICHAVHCNETPVSDCVLTLCLVHLEH